MQVDRIASLIIVVLWIGAVVLFDRPADWPNDFWEWLAVPGLGVVLLALIWFGDELGEFTGMTGRGYVSQTSPGWIVKLLGWIFLAALIIIWIYHATST